MHTLTLARTGAPSPTRRGARSRPRTRSPPRTRARSRPHRPRAGRRPYDRRRFKKRSPCCSAARALAHLTLGPTRTLAPRRPARRRLCFDVPIGIFADSSDQLRAARLSVPPTAKRPWDMPVAVAPRRGANRSERRAARRTSKKPRQLALAFRPHGGRRAGAGRKPKGERAGVAHTPRDRLDETTPVLVTVRVRGHVFNLRARRCYEPIVAAIAKTCARGLVRIVEYSVQRDHIHFVVEADDRSRLWRGISGLCVRIARALNRVMGARGGVFADRFHSRVLTTPRSVRNALAYTLGNARRHGLVDARASARWVDPCSSAPWFQGWCRPVDTPRPTGPPPTVRATCWLLCTGWRRKGGPLDPAHTPGPRS